MLDYRFTHRAERDLLSARRWYNRQDVDLGARFAKDVGSAIEFIRKKPDALVQLADGTRAIRCRDFPYRIYYRIDRQIIVVLAVYHTSREPGRWDDPHRL
jgi:plasmid stabilization system protein ParE